MNITKSVKLYPNENLAICAKKRAAQAGAGAALGVSYTTPSGFIRDSWELFGDGRNLVSDMQRILLVSKLLAQFDLETSIGTAKEVAGFLKDAFYALVAADRSFCETEAERKVYDLALAYKDEIANRGLIEGCEAAKIVAPRFKDQNISFGAPCAISGYVEQFYCDDLGIMLPDFNIDEHKGPGDLEVFYPAGRTMINKMVFDEVEGFLNRNNESPDAQASIALCSQEPMQLYEVLSRTDIRKKSSLALKGSIGFSSTVFGKAFASFCALKKLAENGEAVESVLYDAWLIPASDFASNPYSRVTGFDVSDLPSMEGKELPSSLSSAGLQSVWRSDRTLNANDAIQDLITVSRTFSLFDQLTRISSKDSCENAIKELTGIACSIYSGIQLECERGAIQVLQSISDFAINLGLSIDYPSEFADTCSSRLNEIDLSDSAEQNMPIIQVVSSSDASTLGTSTFDEVIICDVSDEVFNSKHSGSSLDRFAARLGLPMDVGAAKKARISFFQAVSAATDKLVCVMPEHNAKADEEFPSFCFDELMDIRGVLDSNIKKAGEENLQAGAGQRVQAPSSVEMFKPVERGRLDELQLPDRMRKVNGVIVSSASAIEEYISCPYKWFIDRVIRPTTISEGFGPLEGGTFAHSVLEQFYSYLKDLGSKVANEMDDAQYKETLGNVFMDKLSKQCELPLCSNRYIPRSKLEQTEASNLKRRMENAVVLERLFPHEYEPVAFERWLDANDEASRYAGFAVTGMVDRIDERKDGTSFYIIDYKGSTTEFTCGDADFERIVFEDGESGFNPDVIPEHVQTLVYAQVMRRLLDKEGCVAALYTSYKARNRKELVVGAYSTSVEGLRAISNKRSEVNGNFGEFLDMVEAAMSERLNGIHDSYIGIEPNTKDSCKYCILAQSGCC